MSSDVSRDQNSPSGSSSDEESNLVALALAFKGGIKFPLGGDTYVTVKASTHLYETQPSIEISTHKHVKTADGLHAVIPKYLGAVLTPKQFTQFIKNGPLIQSAINSLTQQKPKPNIQRPGSVIRQVKSKTSTPKDKVDFKIAQQPRRKPGRPPKRPNDIDLDKKDVSTQTGAKKQCTAKDDTRTNLMNIVTEAQNTIKPFVC